MKNNTVKIKTLFLIFLFLNSFSYAQNAAMNEVDNFYDNYRLPPQTQIEKQDIIDWLQKLINPSTLIRNKFISDILENALFDEMYYQRKGIDINSRLIIVPLKKTNFSQHISNTGALPFQNLVIDIDKDDNIFTIDVSLISTTDNKIKVLPNNTFNKYFSQNKPLDGNYQFLSVVAADNKIIEVDISEGDRTQVKQWRRKHIKKNLFEWSLVTTKMIYKKDRSDIETVTNTKILGTNNKVCPPNFIGDIRSDDK